MIKAYRYRIYPSDDQKGLFSKQFGHCRWVYNWGLAKKQESYKDTGKSPSKFDLSNLLPDLKKSPETEWLKEACAQSLQASLENLDFAFNGFFKKRSGFPKFKSKYDSAQSYTIPSGIQLDFNHNILWIPKFKDGINIKLSRKIKGEIRKSVISKNACGQYHISIVVEDGKEVPEKPKLNSKEDILGIDVGLKSFIATSKGEIENNPKYLIRSEKKLKKLQKDLSHKQKGSKNRNKSRIKVAKLHQYITNQRTDFLHKTSTKLVSENQAIAREDLNVEGMMKNHKLAKGISDVSWSRFDSMLRYKTEQQGKWYIEIGRFDASTKTCNICNHINHELTLNDREWTCTKCGTLLDRDINSSFNIRDWAYIYWLKEQNEITVPTDGGEFKSVRSKDGIQRKPKHKGVGEVTVGQKEVSARTSKPPTL
jgi:putative transposase